MDGIDFSLIDWSRAQFALTAMFHWLFVPLTLGITFIIAIMETIYVRTGDPEWKKITKFWMTLFGINFAVGVATGIILEFEFGTNWSNYSWFVGDIFGAPLAIEGIMAFFMESTFIAIMFFGWNKVSKKFHLLSTWLTAFGANLSALWILVANGWMQSPVGMRFNPETARNEMVNFGEVLFSPVAVNKFLHTITSGYVLAAVFVVGVSAWFLLKKRHQSMAKRSIIVASVFGLLSALFVAFTGDGSGRQVARVQPMKLAAMEALYEGQTKAPLVVFGFLKDDENEANPYKKEIIAKIEIPVLLSYMSYLDPDAFVPGIDDLINGNPEHGILSSAEKIQRGKIAIETLKAYKQAMKGSDKNATDSLRKKFDDPQFLDEYFKYFGYGYYYDENPEQLKENAYLLIPNVPLSFYSFRIMVALGMFFILLFAVVLFFSLKNKIEDKKWLLLIALFSIPLVYLASQTGWIVAEVGRQPWVIQDLMPTISAVSHLNVGSVQLTFWLFAVLFVVLLIAELKIMLTQIKKGMDVH